MSKPASLTIPYMFFPLKWQKKKNISQREAHDFGTLPIHAKNKEPIIASLALTNKDVLNKMGRCIKLFVCLDPKNAHQGAY